MSGRRHFAVVSVLSAVAIGLLSAFVPAAPRGLGRRPEAAIVHITDVGLRGFTKGMTILVYADGPARVGVGTDPLTALIDTLRLRGLPAFSVDVSNSDVHVQMVGGQPSDGASFSIGGSVTGGSAARVAASGRHMILIKGGNGIRVVNARAVR